MKYPLMSEYIEAIKSPEDNFDKLRHLRPVLDADGNPYMSNGNFAVVFKMTDGEKEYAVKCFTREQEGREEAYQQIAEELKNVSSSFLCPIRYFEKEVFVDTKKSAETEFPVLMMDWVEGVTLDKFVHENRHDKYALESLAYNFCRMAQWLLTQPFAHGDLKPDNILVQSDGALVLVDYDGLFVSAMKGEKARELGSPNYRHPQRTKEQFDEHIDDFSLASIALSLKAIALKPELYNEFGSADRLLFSDDDFRNLAESKVIGKLQPLMSNADILRLYGLFLIAYSEQSLANVSFRLFQISKPVKPAPVEILSTKATDEDWAEAWKDEFGVEYSMDGKKLVKGQQRLRGYNIKPGTKVICDFAFFHFYSSLQSITIPDSVTSIGKMAFYECKYLKRITIPDSVTCIGDGAFSGCKLHINIDSAKFYSDGYCLIDLSSHRLLCCHRKNLKSYLIPNSVTNIGDEAFYGCESLRNITIPDSVTSIGKGAFSSCSSLQSITIPDSLTSIGKGAFFHCSSLQSITIPDSVTSIGDGVFCRCNLHIDIDSSKFYSDGYSLIDLSSHRLLSCHRNDLNNYAIPNSVTSIGNSAFSWCESLQSITIPDSVIRIGDEAFYECSSLQNINIPDSVISIGDRAFSYCKSLQSITIPDSAISIGKETFSYCESLQSINIPRGTRKKFERLLPWDKNKLVEIDM